MNSRSRVPSAVSSAALKISVIAGITIALVIITVMAHRMATAYTRADAGPAVTLHSPTPDAIDDES